MKRLGFFLIIAVFLAGAVFAQSGNDRPNRIDRQRDNTVTVDGTLQLERGMVAVASGDSVYFVPMLTRYIGFIDGLKEGARVSVEGYESRNSIRPVKVTIGGKSYNFIGEQDGRNLSRNDFGRGPDRRSGMQGPNRGYARGGGFGFGSCCW